MARRILIDFAVAPDDHDLNFKIRIFAEDLYRALRSNELASLSLDDVDRVSSRLDIPVRSKRRERRAFTVIEQLLETRFLMQVARLSVTDEMDRLLIEPTYPASISTRPPVAFFTSHAGSRRDAANLQCLR